MDDADALGKIVSILRGLDEDAQRRVLASIDAFLGLNSRPAQALIYRPDTQPLQATVAGGSFSTDRTMSPKEFVRDKQPATDVERVACLAYYLTHFRDTPHFKTVDISSLNVEAAQPKFSSASVAVDNAKKRGLLVASTKGNKQLSASGERYVEMLPDRDAARSSMSAVRTRRTTKRAKGK